MRRIKEKDELLGKEKRAQVDLKDEEKGDETFSTLNVTETVWLLHLHDLMDEMNE